MQGFIRQGSILASTTMAVATPAIAVPQLTGGNLDYFLMPFLGYCGIIGIAWMFYLRKRGKTSKD